MNHGESPWTPLPTILTDANKNTQVNRFQRDAFLSFYVPVSKMILSPYNPIMHLKPCQLKPFFRVVSMVWIFFWLISQAKLAEGVVKRVCWETSPDHLSIYSDRQTDLLSHSALPSHTFLQCLTTP